jgi:hypothetical protein
LITADGNGKLIFTQLVMSARQMGMQAARSIVTHMAGEESELDNGQKLDKQYEVLLVQGGLLLGGDRHERDF